MSQEAKKRLEKKGWKVSCRFVGGPNKVWEATATREGREQKAQGRSEDEAVQYLEMFLQRKEG
jgi:hypothetical protein